MAQENEELNKRRKEREAQRKKRLAQQRRLKLRLVFALVVLVACGIGIYVLSGDAEPMDTAQTTEADQVTEAPVEATTEEATEEATDIPTETSARYQAPKTVIHIRAAGDLNVTDKVVNAANTDMGYDYHKAFIDVAHLLADADLTMLNFEGNLCGAPYGTQTASAPQELMQALADVGVDIVQVANSYSVSNGMLGLATTLQNIRATGIEPVGAFATEAEFRQSKGYTICDVQGVKVAVVAFTKGMGGLGLPAGNESCVNVLYKDYATTYRDIDREGITSILKNLAEEAPDITIAMLHWGSEFNDAISDTQKSIVELLKKNGVDVILGTHSHMVHELSYDETTGFFVAYSLGDFFGDGHRSGTNYSIMVDLEITKDNDTGLTRVTDYSYTPLYILGENEGPDGRQVVRIQETMAAYDLNYIDRITASAYSGMKNAQERISNRVQGKYK